MLLVVTFSFLILMIPAYSMLFYTQFVDFRSSPKLYAVFHLFSAIGTRCYHTNFGINFYLYVISGQKFRSDLIGLFRKMLPCILYRSKTIARKAHSDPSISTTTVSLSVECSTNVISWINWLWQSNNWHWLLPKSHIITSIITCNYPIIYADTIHNPRIVNMTFRALLDTWVMLGKSYLTIIASNDKL